MDDQLGALQRRGDRGGVGDVGDTRASAPGRPIRSAGAAAMSMPMTSAPSAARRRSDRRADEAARAGRRPRACRLACRRSWRPTYTRPPRGQRAERPARPRKEAARPSSTVGPGRQAGAAAAALAAAIALPLLRKRLRIPPAVTVGGARGRAAGAGGAAAAHRTRDAALYALQMWGFLNAKDLPHDDPEALRRRLRIDYPITADLAIGGGELPTCACRRPWPGSARATRSTAPSPGCTGSGSSSRTARWSGSSPRHPERFARSARQMAGVYDLGCAVYCGRADRAALVGVRGGAHRREGEADHGRGGGGAVGAESGTRCTPSSAATPGPRCPRSISRPR